MKLLEKRYKKNSQNEKYESSERKGSHEKNLYHRQAVNKV